MKPETQWQAREHCQSNAEKPIMNKTGNDRNATDPKIGKEQRTKQARNRRRRANEPAKQGKTMTNSFLFRQTQKTLCALTPPCLWLQPSFSSRLFTGPRRQMCEISLPEFGALSRESQTSNILTLSIGKPAI
jgi:hypothetical protein